MNLKNNLKNDILLALFAKKTGRFVKMKTKSYTKKTGKIKTFHLENEVLTYDGSKKPSMRVFETKEGRRAIEGLIDIEENHNHSWYSELKIRAKKNPNAIALFYRGTKISFEQMIDTSGKLAKSFAELGIKKGDEIPACLSNTPETVYILLALNKIGAKINLFSNHLNDEYLKSILDGCSNKLFLATDDVYDKVENIIKDREYESIVITSLADSLPAHPELCDEYEADLDKYYHYDYKVDYFKKNDNRISNFKSLMKLGELSNISVNSDSKLDDEFLVTYTSGSTRVGFPKMIVHTNRSLITSGRFHDSELSGNPDLKGLRGLAHIHLDSNTNIITCISDNLMQLWTVALEPEYDKEKALDYLFINKPNYLNMTTSFLVEVSKQYLFERKFHENGKGRKMPWLFACFAVGECVSKGEEKLINRMLRVSRAGSGVKIGPFSFPFTTLCIGGGDVEHGGIYYTLWKALYDKINYFRLKNHEMGLKPEAYVQVSAFKYREDGLYEECGINEYGLIAANSATTTVGYKDDKDKTARLIISDTIGRDWVSSNVYGYIDELGGVHVKGRLGNVVSLKNGDNIPTFIIENIVELDTKNILSCSVVPVVESGINTYVINLEFQPDVNMNKDKIIESLAARLKKYGINESFHYRIIDNKTSFPLTGSGKRNIPALENMGFYNTSYYSNNYENDNEKKSGNKILKKIINR